MTNDSRPAISWQPGTVHDAIQSILQVLEGPLVTLEAVWEAPAAHHADLLSALTQKMSWWQSAALQTQTNESL